MSKIIADSLARRLIAAHEFPGVATGDLEGFAPVATVHVRHDDYQSYEQLIVRDPGGELFAFEIVRNFGVGEGEHPEPSDQHAVEIELTPMVARQVHAFEYYPA